MPAQGLDVLGLAQLVLASIEAQFADAGVALPERRFVGAGEATSLAWDCAQVVVTLGNVRSGISPLGGAPAQKPVQFISTNLRSVQIDAQLVLGGVPTNMGKNLPPVAALQRHGLEFMRAAGLFSQAMIRAVEGVKTTSSPGAQVVLSDMTPIGPAGQYVGLQQSLAATQIRLA